MNRLSRKPATATLLGTCLTLLLTASLHASVPLLERVSNPPSLKPLPVTTHGRVLKLPAASSAFGQNELVGQWPGISFEAAFKGTEVFFRPGKTHMTLHIVVDGQPPLLLTDPEEAVYRVSGLDKGRHLITVSVASESQSAPNRFFGFAVSPGETALPVPRPTRQIEFIGDSHTVGYGNTSTSRECSDAELFARTDDTQSFGPLTAARYNADYEINAISGRGIVRNYNGFAADHLPEAYPYLLFDKQTKTSDETWKPQWIVIALGTNDFSTALNPDEKWKTRDQLYEDYEATYLKFLQTLRAANPKAFLLLWAAARSNGEVESEERRVVDRMTALGDRNIGFLLIEHLAFDGCHFHPSVADDKIISDRLVHYVEAHPGFWKN